MQTGSLKSVQAACFIKKTKNNPFDTSSIKWVIFISNVGMTFAQPKQQPSKLIIQK